MSEPAIATYDALKALGFIKDNSFFSDDPGGLSFDFGDLKLDATHCLNHNLVNVVMLNGVMKTPRTIADVSFELPIYLQSLEQTAALVAYCLDKHSGGPFRPAVPVSWLETGRQNQHLLPWRQARAAAG